MVPSWLMSLFAGVWGYLACGIGASLVVGMAIHKLDANIYSVKISSLKTEIAQKDKDNAETSLKELQTFIGNMNKSATDYENLQTALFGKLDTLAGEFNNAARKNPLPVDCKPDASRLLSLTNSIHAANNSSAGQ